MNVEQRLRTALHDGASRLTVPEEGPGAAQQRARQRGRRVHGLVATSVVAVLAIGVATVWGGVLDPAPTVLMDGGGGEVEPGAAAPVEVEPLRLQWREADGVVGSARETFLGSDGAYYALSTAPGVRWQDHPRGDLPQALYRSGDGLDWEVVELGDEPWVASLGERGGLLYALSTAPGTRGGSGRIAVSGDLGQTWQRADLPSVAAPPAASVPLLDAHVTGHLAVGDDLLVATVHTRYPVDITEVFAGDLAQERMVQPTPDGFAVFEAPAGRLDVRNPGALLDEMSVDAPGDPAGHEARAREVVVEVDDAYPFDEAAALRTVTWQDMGLDGPDDLAVQELFVSGDGVDWEAVPSPFGGQGVQALEATPHGFVAVLQPAETGTSGGPGTVELMLSADGVAWEAAGDGAAAAAQPLQGVGVVDGGRLLAVPHYGEGSLTGATSDDGGRTWSELDLAAVLPGDGYTHMGVLASGTGPLGAALAVVAVGDGDGYEPSFFLLTSTDGLGWSVTPLADVVGDVRPSEVSWLTVGRDTITLGVTLPPLEDGQIAPSRTFVGTPTR